MGVPCYNNQRCRERRKPLTTTQTILENDTEKSHFVQERRYGSAERCDDRINSQILNE